MEYGDRLGGVIDVRTRPGKTDRLRQKYSISTIQANFITEGPVGDEQSGNSFFLAGRRSYIDLIFSPSQFNDLIEDEDKEEDEQDRIIQVPEFFDVQAGYRYNLEHGYLDAYYYSAGDEIKLIDNENKKTDPQLSGTLVSDQIYHTLGVTWNRPLADRWLLDMPLALVYQKDTLRFGNDEDGNPFFAETENVSIHLLPMFTWQQDTEHAVDLGVDVQYFHVPLDLYISRPPDETDPDFDFTTAKKYRVSGTIDARGLGAYAKYRIQHNARFRSNWGLRYSSGKIDHATNIDEWSPRLSMEYDLTPETTLLGSWGRYVQFPQGYQVLEGFGNPGLRYTESEHRILGVQHEFNELWNVKVEAYQKPMDDLVINVDAQEPPDNYANQGKGESYGLDVYLKRERKAGVMGWLSYSYARSERENKLSGKERDFSGDQPHTLTLVWSQPFTRGGFDWMKKAKRWSWGIKFQARSGQPHTRVIGRRREEPGNEESRWLPIYEEHNNSRLPNYYRLDFRVEKEFLFNSYAGKFYFDVTNAFNINNVVDYDYGDEYERYDNPKEVTGLPLFPYIGVEFAL